MFEKVSQILNKHKILEERLSDPAVLKDRKKFEQTAREHKELSQIVQAYGEWSRVKTALDEARALLAEADPEMRGLAQAEIEEKEPLLETAILRLRQLLLPRDPNDQKNVILEIRAGTGGNEAALFAADLCRMYARYAELQGWKIEELSRSGSDLGGLKEVSVLIKGEGVYSRLRYESGTHRVQRVPVTEAQGRIHTSAATVAVLPEAEEVEVNIGEKDLRIDVYRSSGPGGQHVNTTDSAVRITHLPTGLVVTCQDEKSQHKNKAKAMKILSAHLLDLKIREQMTERSAQRKSLIGSGDRSERIRTYNFPQDRVTDHRIGLTLHNLPAFMAGEIGEMVQRVIESREAERLAELEESETEIAAG
ncbi:MAG: peptide chain release factor 1 [Nitrospinota bacterium]